MTYTYDDIVTAKDILTDRVKREDIIGKKGLFLNCIPTDMSLNTLMRIGFQRKLDDIELDGSFGFSCGDDYYLYFLPEKEESARKGPHSMFMPSSFPVEGGYSVGESSALASFFAFSSFCFLF